MSNSEFYSATHRIAIVGNQAFTLIRFRGLLIKRLIADGHSVYAFMPDGTAEDYETVRGLGAEPVAFELDRTGLNPFRDLRTVIGLRREFRRRDISLVLCYFIKPVIYGLWAARLSGVKRRFALIEGAGTAFAEEEGRALKRRALKNIVIRLYRSALRHAHRVFFLNQDDLGLFENSGMISPGQAKVLPGIGIDLDEFAVAASPPGPITFVMLTRLLGQKGVREYASAARIVKQRYPNTRFVLLGGLESNPDGIGEAEARSWVDEGCLEWPGRVNDVQAWLASAHAFVLPSYREGFPRSTMEAMAVGRAIITTDVVGCRETVITGENGLMVAPRDVNALAGAMRQMIETPEVMVRMGAASRKIAEERFDVKKINQMFLEGMGLARSE